VGVMGATVQLGAKTARVQYLPEIITLSEMKQAVQHVGYEARERDVA
jgi:copper chaperone CopZ